ncbi:MAG: nickel pincer cofactor biosynthesis protein LarC [bacterium]|nr:nickel pincer cofactor biosynthesis protein LarC [bacterium]
MIAYFDCFSGISGDMILGSLVDAGFSLIELKKELKKLLIPGYRIESKRAPRNGILGTQVKIIVSSSYKAEKVHRKLEDIISLINRSGLGNDIKSKSKEIFSRIAIVEAKIHNKQVEDIHFHEVGAVDSIIDVIGALIGIKYLGIEKVYSSPLNLGTGFVKCSHGILPVPAPATAELIKGIPIYSTGINSELVTPTGAAIITSLAEKFGEMPLMRVEKVGYGIGGKELRIPNMLRVFIGNKIEKLQEDMVSLIETNIDDMNPQFYDYVIEELFNNGAKDVYITPIYMKKNRPSIILSVISPIDKVNELTAIIFKHTTTMGVRVTEMVKREKLVRKIKKVVTKFGNIKVKIGIFGNKVVKILPEYEDCKRIAKTEKISINDVYNEALRVTQNKLWTRDIKK